ncbi:MAG: GAF domain-containing protein, partial [Deltaproteobacteria bacterium]|nr:GAF domain-containing protein [Deltaproteobacteria bacterium]
MDDQSPIYNSRIIKIYLEYLRRYYPRIDPNSVLEYMGATRFEVNDQAHWFNQEQIDRFHDMLVAKTGNPHISRDAGAYAVSSESFGRIKKYLLGFMSLSSVYLLIGKIYPLMSRGADVEAKKIGPNQVEIISSPKQGVNEKPFQCANRMGSLESAAKLFTRNFAHIDHPSCFHRGDAACRYIITWHKIASFCWKRIRNYASLSFLLIALFFLFLLPPTGWLLLLTVFIAATLSMTLISTGLEKRDLTRVVTSQANAEKAVLDEMNIRYKYGLLIHEIGKATSTIKDMDELLRCVMQIIEKQMHFERGMILLPDQQSPRFLYAGGFGFGGDQEARLKLSSVNVKNSRLEKMFTQGVGDQKPYILNYKDEIKRMFSFTDRDYTEILNDQFFVGLPVFYEQHLLGILMFETTTPKNLLTHTDINLLMGVASQMAIGLNEIRSFKKLQMSEEKYRNILKNIEDA